MVSNVTPTLPENTPPTGARLAQVGRLSTAVRSTVQGAGGGEMPSAPLNRSRTGVASAGASAGVSQFIVRPNPGVTPEAGFAPTLPPTTTVARPQLAPPFVEYSSVR